MRDLDSKHGTLVNGQPISRHELRSGDQLTIGLTTLAIQVLDDAVTEAPSTFADASNLALKPAAL